MLATHGVVHVAEAIACEKTVPFWHSESILGVSTLLLLTPIHLSALKASITMKSTFLGFSDLVFLLFDMLEHGLNEG